MQHRWLTKTYQIVKNKPFRRVSGQVGLPKVTNTYHLNRKQNGNIWKEGTVASTLTPREGGDVIQDERKYLEIFQRQSDGSWKYWRAIWNSDSPAG